MARREEKPSGSAGRPFQSRIVFRLFSRLERWRTLPLRERNLAYCSVIDGLESPCSSLNSTSFPDVALRRGHSVRLFFIVLAGFMAFVFLFAFFGTFFITCFAEFLENLHLRLLPQSGFSCFSVVFRNYATVLSLYKLVAFRFAVK